MNEDNQIVSLKDRVRYLEDELDSAREAAVKSERMMLEYLDENKRMTRVLNSIIAGRASKGIPKSRRPCRAVKLRKDESQSRRLTGRLMKGVA